MSEPVIVKAKAVTPEHREQVLNAWGWLSLALAGREGEEYARLRELMRRSYQIAAERGPVTFITVEDGNK